MKKFGEVLKEDKNNLFDFLFLVKNWKEVVGEGLAKHSIPLKIQMQTLTIITKHPTIAQELNFMGEKIKESILGKFPQLKAHVKKITFQNNPVIFEQMKKDEEFFEQREVVRFQERHPNSPEYQKKCQEAETFYGDSIGEDPEIKELLLSLRIQQRSKGKF